MDANAAPTSPSVDSPYVPDRGAVVEFAVPLALGLRALADRVEQGEVFANTAEFFVSLVSPVDGDAMAEWAEDPRGRPLPRQRVREAVVSVSVRESSGGR